MSKYNVGDVVKLRDDLEVDRGYGLGIHFVSGMNHLKRKPVVIEICEKDSCGEWYKVENGDWNITDEMIEGLWEECKGITYEPYEEEPKTKLKLIDVLNKIAKGELKEDCRTEIKMKGLYYKLFACETADNLLTDLFIHLNEEVELIEPPCEHEWLNWETHGIGEGIIRRFRRCVKCGLEEVTEKCVPDVGNIIEHSKIEELKYDDFWEWDAYSAGEDEEEFVGTETAIKMIFNKLNEVIRYINKE